MVDDKGLNREENVSVNACDKWICSSCIGEKHLKAVIDKKGIIHKCSFCGHENKAVTVENLSRLVFPVFNDYVKQQNNVEDGNSLEAVISELLNAGNNVAQSVIQAMKKDHQEDYIQYWGYDCFDGDCSYTIEPTFFSGMEVKWEIACDNLKSNSRFFNDEFKALLDDIFEGIPETAVKEFAANDSVRLYRASVASSKKHVEEILSNPEEQFGPPPLSSIFGGRMNPVGIPVLYTSLDSETACAEVRPHLDAMVIIASFSPLRSLRLLDLTNLGDYEIEASPFDPDLQKTLDRKYFAEQFSHWLSKPVNPQSESIDYLPTQCVADYLSNSFEKKIDGFICHSAMRKGGKNVVIFKRASQIKLDNKNFLAPKIEYIAAWNEEETDTIKIDPFHQAKEKIYRDTPVLELKSKDIQIRKAKSISYSFSDCSVKWGDNTESGEHKDC